MPEAAFRFTPGDRVRILNAAAETHCRTPAYLRGKSGVVTEIAGTYRNPSQMAFHKPGLPPIPLYRVRFRQTDLWPEAPDRPDSLAADIYEHWLAPDVEER